MKVFKTAKAPALECCSLLNASYATFIWKQRPVGKKGIWEQRGIPRASWLLQTQLSLSNPSSCSGHRHNHLPQVSSCPVLTGKIIHTELHEDNTPCRELQWSSFTQGCRMASFKMSLYYSCSFSISITTATGKPNTYWQTNVQIQLRYLFMLQLGRNIRDFSNELWGAKN